MKPPQHPAPGSTEGDRRRLRPYAVGLLLVALLAAVAGLAGAALYTLYPYPYRPVVRQQAAAAGLDPLLVLAVIRAESRFDPESRSARGAIGLMQVVPATGEWIAAQRGEGFSPDQLLDPTVNITYGTWYLGMLWRSFGGRTAAALAAYNAGIGRVSEWIAAGAWSGRTADLQRIPYPETRRFVGRVLRNWRLYRLLYRRA